MHVVLRLVVTAVCFMATFFFVFWVPFSLVLPDRTSNMVPLAGSAACAALVAAFVWRGLESLPQGLARSVLLGAVVTGGVGFVGGFFGPILLAPGANQGPLLGLFITGPLGTVVGAVGGGVLWWVRGRTPVRSLPPEGRRPARASFAPAGHGASVVHPLKQQRDRDHAARRRHDG